jgi:hypothetical protein
MPISTSVITGTVAHKHSATGGSGDGGKLATGGLGGDTSFDLANGSLMFSNGTSLDELVIGGSGTVLTESGGVPTWGSSPSGGSWTTLADVVLSTPGTLVTPAFSAQDKFLKVLFYGASVSSTTLGLTCNGTAGATEYATRFERDFTTTGIASAENSMFYFSGVTTNEFCMMELEGYNGATAGADKLFHLNTTANTTTGGTACQSYENYCKYYGGSYVTSFEMVDANPGTTINFQTGSRLVVLSTP